MALERSTRPLVACLRSTRHERSPLPFRSISTTSIIRQIETNTTTVSAIDLPPPPPPSQQSTTPLLDSNSTHAQRSERKLSHTKSQPPIGSRRRRAALKSTSGIAFQQLPYQCFQEARKVILQDREEKVTEIEKYRERIRRLEEREVEVQDEAPKEHRLKSMRRRLEETKILADVNDPLVKKKFEDGDGDMTKPIYRHLALRKWNSYKRPLLLQRITQMNVVPDVLPHIEPSVRTALAFPLRGTRVKKVEHGEILLSSISEQAPSIEIQPFDKGERLVTIAVVNPDVPDVSRDAFGYRCHFLASNIRISPTETDVDLASLDKEEQVILDWWPAYAQKGVGYQRMSVFVLEQPIREQDAAVQSEKEARDPSLDVPESRASQSPAPPSIEAVNANMDIAVTSTLTSPNSANTNTTRSQPLPISLIKSQPRYTQREGFILRSFVDKYHLHPVGVDLFRTQWDEDTAGVMHRAGVVGADVEFRRKRVEPLPYQRLKGERFR